MTDRSCVIQNGKVVLSDRVVQTDVVIEDGKILSVGACSEKNIKVVDARGGYVLPGFIDIHAHGGGSADYMDNTVEAISLATKTHLEHGTTTMFPTTMSAAFDEVVAFLCTLREYKKNGEYKEVLQGAHLEGPFLNPVKCGAQNKDLIVTPTQAHIQTLQAYSDVVARVSCAPEMEGVLSMAKALLPYGVQFSLGHTDATYEQAEEAVEAGFTSVTHIYSATSGFHKVGQKVHIGVTQAGFGIDELYIEMIGDGFHVPKQLLRLAHKIKDVGHICLVTDAMRAAGTDLTESYLGKVCPENRVIIEEGVAKLPDRSFFAGSIGTMDRAFRFAVKNAGLPVWDVSKMTSLNQAKLMKIDDRKGSIEVGKDADFVLLNEDCYVQSVLLAGEVVF